jgi:hypothetical protein
MTSGFLGSPTGNVIVPVTNFTKRTKQISTVTITAGAYLTSITNLVSKCIFYADSNGVWRMDGTFRFSANLATASVCQFTIDGVVASDTANYVGIGSVQIEDASYTSVGHIAAIAQYNTTNTIVEIQYGASVTGENGKIIDVCFYGLVLKSEPLTYTTAAALENNVNVAAYIPPASTTTPGLVDDQARTWNGVKTFASAPVFNAGVLLDDAGGVQTALNFYAEDDVTFASVTLNPNGAGSGNSTAFAAKITRIGRMVYVLFPSNTTCDPAGTTSGLALSTVLPSWARPTSETYAAAWIYNNNAWQSNIGTCVIDTAGVITFYRDLVGSAFTNGTNVAGIVSQTIVFSR